MGNTPDNHGLDMHCTMILNEYREYLPVFEKMREIICTSLSESISTSNIYLNAMESRVKAEDSLCGKLERKGAKYHSIKDLTDIVGVRLITFYNDEVDKISALVDHLFDVDWENSVDKRKMHELNSFGYSSLHYICRIPEALYSDPAHPEINEFRFEVQMRTALQHVWSVLHHDTGYKSGIEVPREYLRNLSRLAGMLELADEQFCIIRTGINDYRRKVQNLVADGQFDDIPLNGDSFKSYLNLRPFDKLASRIAAINQAEIHESPMFPYLRIFKEFGFETLGDVERLISQNSEDAYKLAVYQLGGTDLDIISSTVAIQDLCVVFLLKKKSGAGEIKRMFDLLDGESDKNLARAERILNTAKKLSFK